MIHTITIISALLFTAGLVGAIHASHITTPEQKMERWLKMNSQTIWDNLRMCKLTYGSTVGRHHQGEGRVHVGQIPGVVL